MSNPAGNVSAVVIEKIKVTTIADYELINTVSHELKTPMTSIKAFTQLLQTRCLETCPDPKKIHYLSLINSQVDKMTELINELLQAPRPKN